MVSVHFSGLWRKPLARQLGRKNGKNGEKWCQKNGVSSFFWTLAGDKWCQFIFPLPASGKMN